MRDRVNTRGACRAPLVLALLLGGLAAGCGPATTGRFRLVSLDGELAVTPPPYSKRALHKPPQVAVPVPAQSLPRDSSGCSIHGRLFRVEPPGPRGRAWRVTLPSLDQWRRAERADTFRKEFGDFLDGIEMLETRNCLPAGSGRMLAEWMRESVPMKNGEALLYRYDFGRGEGFIDLDAGMKLGIERAVYGPDKKFAGTQAAAYELSRDTGGGLEFRPAEAAGSPERVTALDPSTPDLTLAERVHGFPYYRLFYLGDFVPKESNYEAMVVGTNTRGRMEKITAALRRRTASICPQDSPADPVDCQLFQGAVTVTADVGVTVNGKLVFGTPGLTVGDALSADHLVECRENPGKVRVERRYLLGYAPVTSGADRASILKLRVFAGDRIACPLPR